MVIIIITPALVALVSDGTDAQKWSAPLWDYDIATLDELDIEELFAYADDLGLIYEVNDENRGFIIDHINEDFDKLEKWAKEWCVTFAVMQLTKLK